MRMRKSEPARSGAVVVEFAFMVPLVLLLIFAIIEHGRYFMMANLMRNAAREGARLAALSTGQPDSVINDDTIRGVVMDRLGTQTNNLENFDPAVNIQIYGPLASPGPPPTYNPWKGTAFGEMVSVEITGNFNAIIPVFVSMQQDGFGNNQIMPGTISFRIVEAAFSELQ